MEKITTEHCKMASRFIEACANEKKKCDRYVKTAFKSLIMEIIT